MINHDHLLAQARRLAKPPSAGRPKQADLRRAVSTAYYAMFHFALRDGADHLVGSSPAKRNSKAWAMVYRAYRHNEMARRCGQVGNPPTPLTGADFGREVRRFAAEFKTLQNERHRADYDPTVKLTLSTVQGRIGAARRAIRLLTKAPAEERRLFSTFLLLGVRSDS